MLLYIDSLFAEGRERVVRPLHTILPTLNQLYLLGMLEHARAAVLMHWQGGRWNLTPDWRLDRHVIRIGLYLRERVGIQPGDRVAILSELRPEWPVADFAILTSGAVSVTADPSLPGDEVVKALIEEGPRAAFLSGRALETLGDALERVPGLEHWIVFDPAPPQERAALFGSALDLGGTLDTPEHASAFRTQARDVPPDEPALCHYEGSGEGSLEVHRLTQGETIEQLKRDWLWHPASKADLAYIVGPELTLTARLALYAFVADGLSTTVLGTPGREAGEIAALRPDKIVAPAAVLEAAVRKRLAQTNGRMSGVRNWLRLAARLAPGGRAKQERRAIRTALGGRARWIGSTGPLDPALSARLSAVVTMGPEGPEGPEGPDGHSTNGDWV